MKLKGLLVLIVGTLICSAFSTLTFAKGTVKIAFMDPLSGGFAEVGDLGYKHVKFVADKINAEGGFLNGTTLEIVPFDNKFNPQESLVQLKHIVDQDIRFLIHGNGSSVAAALIDAIKKHNKRNPDNTILYLNYAAILPAFTEDLCNFWHFRFDAHVGMKISAITDAIVRSGVKKVYLIDQDYSFGHDVSDTTKAMLKQKDPSIQIVGDDFHPASKVQDFSPYVAKILKSGAQAVVTGNWGNDMTLLAKAANEAGLKAKFYTFYAGGLGTPRAAGDAFDGLAQITEWHVNLSVEQNKPQDEQFYLEYQKKYSDGGKSPFFYGRIRTMMEMLVNAFNKAGSTDPKAVAYALEGMEYNDYYGKDVMRAQDHQLLQPLFISEFVRVGSSKTVKYDVDNTPYGPKTVEKIDTMDTAMPSSCKMERP